MKHLINYFRNSIKSFVLIGLFVVLSGASLARAGSYEDFFTAIRRDDARTIETLLLRGFDANTLDPNAQHALYLAAREPSPAAANALLLASSINVNHLNAKGESPLAAEFGLKRFREGRFIDESVAAGVAH
jgi:ankyrin repeat protein